MCGRKAFNLTWREIHDLLEHGVFPERFERLIRASYNVAPGHEMPIVFADAGERRVMFSRWGFTPVWWTKAEPPRHTINARAETVATSTMFKGAFRSARCIVPVSGYYEWQVQGDGSKQPFYIHRADEKPLLLAGIHACNGDADTYAVITTTAPHGMERLHERSPVVIEREDVGRWLDREAGMGEVQALCRPAADGVLMWHPVSKAVGNVRNDSAELVREVPWERPLLG